MDITAWFSNNYVEVFGAITGIIYVFLEIRQNIWLWPLGLLTSGVYIWVFFTSKFYADMSLQVYYVVISMFGWYWWVRGRGVRRKEEGEKRRGGESGIESGIERGGEGMTVTRITFRLGVIIAIVSVILYGLMFTVLSEFTDSPVPEWDSFITSLSVVATWMLARKIYEHWYLWVVVNSVSAIIFFARGLYPTVFLYIIYMIMSFAGMIEWKKSFKSSPSTPNLEH